MELSYNARPRFTEEIARHQLKADPLIVVDVGVAGGEGPRWDHFGTNVVVHGFDPRWEAILPLLAMRRARRRYYAMALGNADGEQDFHIAEEPTASSFYAKSSSAYDVASSVTCNAEVRQVPIRRLDSLLQKVDFIKIDTEGFEPEVLKGAKGCLRNGVLAIEVETNFNTSAILPRSHFGHVCDEIVPYGLTLFDITFDRVPRANFAARVLELGCLGRAQTVSRPATVNALFYRDAPAASFEELLKRVAILEIYGLADTAYDVLMAGADLAPPGFQLQEAADLLVVPG